MYFKNKILNFSIDYRKCGHEYKRVFKEQQSIEILKNYWFN